MLGRPPVKRRSGGLSQKFLKFYIGDLEIGFFSIQEIGFLSHLRSSIQGTSEFCLTLSLRSTIVKLWLYLIAIFVLAFY